MGARRATGAEKGNGVLIAFYCPLARAEVSAALGYKSSAHLSVREGIIDGTTDWNEGD
jgi:hypothetical protein